MSRIFGKTVTQNGYVVRDIEAAMKHWIEVLGVGPWFYMENIPVEDFRYKGEPSPMEFAVALANSGDFQLELIMQLNDAPSLYKDFLDAGHEGLQHIAYWTETMDADLERILGAGYEIGQSGHVGENGRFVYFLTEGHPGTVIELSEVSGRKGQFFKKIKAAAQDWDGSDPIRTIATLAE